MNLILEAATYAPNGMHLETWQDVYKRQRVNNANIEPVFFAYPDNAALDAVISRYTVGKPVYDFIAPGDGCLLYTSRCV